MPKSLLNNARILIIDDEPSNVRLLERILEMFGTPSIRSTTDSRQALPLYFEFSPDIILLDLHMPHFDGFALIDLLKTAIPAEEYLPILVLTADITVETKRRALSAGARDFLTKPLDRFEVVLRIENLLENRFLHRELQRQNETLEQQVHARTAQLEALLNELRVTQEKVVKQERLRALGKMAGSIAHDFNNALTMVLGYGELLLPYALQHAPERETGYLRSMITSAQDAAQIVNRLREFYRPALNNELRVPVNLNDLVQQAVALTAPKWRERSRSEGGAIEVVADLKSSALISGNATELRGALTNLISNAVDAMPTGGQISLATRNIDEGVLLSVSDTGSGMSADDQARCLEPFFTTKGEGGTGLGLSVVYGIVQRHGGNIEITSQLGKGTTFSVFFPPATLLGASTAGEPVELPGVDRPLRVLVADDQEVIAELVAEYLRLDGHEVTVCLDGQAALTHFVATSFDLVITDQTMPGLSGEELARAIAGLTPGKPVILLSATNEEIEARGALSEGVSLLVAKPVSAAELRRAVRKVSQPGPATPVLA